MSTSTTTRPARTRLLAAGAIAALALTACGSEDAAPADAAGGGDTASAASASTDLLEVAYDGVLGAPPTTPVEITSTKDVWIVSCGERVPTCARPSADVVTAAETAGWSAKVCDGQLNPQGWSDCIRQGISAESDGIIAIGLDCVSIQGALQEARAAKIPTVAAGGADCDVTGGEPLYSAVVTKLEGLSAEQWWGTMGALQADWIIGQTEGAAKVLSLRFSDGLFGPWIQQGFEAELAEACPDCEIAATVDIANSDVVGGQLAQKFETALLQNPDVNAVNVPLDGWFFAGLSQAVTASGRSDSLAVIGNFAEPGNLDFIRNGAGQDASVGFAGSWEGWAGIDALARLDAGQPLQPAGVGLQVVDADRNLPSGPEFSYEPVIDYRAAYTKAWGK